MSVDRYEYVARVLKYFGWAANITLRNTRRHAVEILKERGARSVVDACCGAGTLSRYLRDCGIDVTGVDASPAMLALARKKAPGVKFLEADLTTVNLEEPVDGAVIALALHEMGEQVRSIVWESMRRITKPGGPLIVVDYAVSERRGIGAWLCWKSIWSDEKRIGKHDPGHFENFKEFMELGGTETWLVNRGEAIVHERSFLWGHMGVFVVNG